MKSLGCLLAAMMLASCAGGNLYDWEKNRKEIPDFSSMYLCYGTSAHRTPKTWDCERFAPLVSHIDSTGSEHWLFDSFLMLEVWDLEDAKSFGFGYRGESADKAAWTKFIDYWFEPEHGLAALDAAIDSVASRIGKAPSKRTVVMNLPDPIMYKMFNDSTTTSVYWGSLEDGRELDFRSGKDRQAALKWYVDQVRRRWNEARFRNLELIGFYIVSEDLAIPGDGWSAELKHYEDVFPEFCDYIHSCNEAVYWIPYYEAAPYTKWRELGIDEAIMQPNRYWDDIGRCSFDKFFSMIEENGLDMELEMDEQILGSSEKAMMYKARFREYLNQARERGVYGRKRFALFANNYAFTAMATSDDPEDIRLYREICEFIIDNPYKK